MTYTEVLKFCHLNLFNRDQVGGHFDLTRPSVCRYHAFSNMYRNHHHWRVCISPYHQYHDRCTLRILRGLGNTIMMNLVKSDREISIKSQDDLEKAWTDGFRYLPGKQHQISHDITREVSEYIDTWEPSVRRSGSPAHLTIAQLRLAMRHIYRHLFSGNRLDPIIEGLPYHDLNQRLHKKLVAYPLPMFVRELVYAFYNQTRTSNWWSELRQLVRNLAGPDSTELYAQFVAKVWFDALDKGEAFKKEWKTSTVIALVNRIWQEEEFGTMPILADALEDAGCDNSELLSHLRDPEAEITLGSWVFRCCGKLK